MAKPNPRALIPIGLVAALLAGGWYVEHQRARERSSLSGFFESRPTQVASRIGGRVSAIKVREGDAVKAGDLLIVLETKPASAETDAKEAQANQARAMAADLRNGPRPEEIRRQEAAVAEATANLERLRNGSRPEEVAAARARADQAQAQYRKVKAGARPQEIAGVRAAERAAYARLQQARRGLTPEERAQARARAEAARYAESLAAKDQERMEYLVREGAESQQRLDRTRTDLQIAHARTTEIQEALNRAEAGTPREELDQSNEAYRQAKAALDLVLAGSRKEDVEAARAEAAAMVDNFKLLQRGSRQEDIRAADARVRSARAQLDEMRAGSRKEQIAAARAGARAAEAQVRAAKANLSEREIRAPQPGVVERVLIAAGDLVHAESPVMRLASQDDIWLRVYMPETGLARVKIGTEATLRIDGVSDEIPAVVDSIAARGEFTPANLQTPDERGKQVFGVRLRLVKPNPNVKAGMFATVRRLGDQAW